MIPRQEVLWSLPSTRGQGYDVAMHGPQNRSVRVFLPASRGRRPHLQLQLWYLRLSIQYECRLRLCVYYCGAVLTPILLNRLCLLIFELVHLTAFNLCCSPKSALFSFLFLLFVFLCSFSLDFLTSFTFNIFYFIIFFFPFCLLSLSLSLPFFLFFFFFPIPLPLLFWVSFHLLSFYAFTFLFFLSFWCS